MKLLASALVCLSVFAQSITISRSGSQPSSSQGEAEYFTGSVRMDPLFPASDQSRLAGHASRLSRALAPRGTHTRRARRSLSRQEPDGCNIGAARCRRCAKEMWFAFHRG